MTAHPSDFAYQSVIPSLPNTRPMRTLTSEGVSSDDHGCLHIDPAALTLLSRTAFHDINHFLRTDHLQQLRSILDDPEASDNDRFVAFDLLKNANIAAGGVLPMCQDTGTAIIAAKRGHRVMTDGDDEKHLAQGVFEAYRDNNLRYSQLAPLSLFEEKNTRTNLPAQIDITMGRGAYVEATFIAKGGGSANKTFLFQATPSMLNEARLTAFLNEKIKTLGTAACPPYHLAVVIGGLSAEMTLKVAKMASTRALDGLPAEGSTAATAFRDRAFEQTVHKMTQNMGIGAQFGGKYFCHDVRVIRLPRHGASLPIAIAVSCSADRQAVGIIDASGVHLEKLERDPAQFLPDGTIEAAINDDADVVAIDLNQPMAAMLKELDAHPIKTRLSLTGTIIVARDLAHARIEKALDAGEPMPDYFKNHPIYYAGPAKTPENYASGSFGPTTAGRMDGFIDKFQAQGGSMISLAKGNRSRQVRAACAKHGGFYLGSIGGPAARLAQDCIKKIEVLEFPEFGMEAVHRIEVENFPAFIVIDNKGNDFFSELNIDAHD
ncbi:MAG: FumA C-terminus/TtdB family hydratase beta subunit [Alphaproteobacteria bacterium]|nr:FumA C-terminus/TtdB family hydratase beta subunit [Alphaproteobacteria bacterium]